MGFIILACIVAVILLLLLMRFRLLLSYKDGVFKLYLKVLFLKFELFGNKKERLKKSDFKIKKFRRRRDKVLKKYRIKKAASKKTIENNVKKKKTSPLILIKELKDVIIDTVKLFGRCLKIDKFKVRIQVGGKDAAKVALNYGYVIQALQYLVTLLECITNLDKTKHKSAEVEADFKNEEFDADINIAVSIRTVHGIRLGIKALLGYFKFKSLDKKGNK